VDTITTTTRQSQHRSRNRSSATKGCAISIGNDTALSVLTSFGINPAHWRRLNSARKADPRLRFVLVRTMAVQPRHPPAPAAAAALSAMLLAVLLPLLLLLLLFLLLPPTPPLLLLLLLLMVVVVWWCGVVVMCGCGGATVSAFDRTLLSS